MKMLLIHRTRVSYSYALKIISGQNPLCLDFFANTMVFPDSIPVRALSVICSIEIYKIIMLRSIRKSKLQG